VGLLDRTLVAPSTDELVRLLGRGQKSANGSLPARRIDKGPEEWEKAAGKVARQAEGRLDWNGGRGREAHAHLMLAWWTDRLGRRHARVLGCQQPIQGPLRLLDGAREKAPIWSVYPGPLVERRQGDRTDLLAVCPCGACGALPALGWMGDRCGPCHDRREEGEGAPTGRPDRLQVNNTHWGDLDDLLFLEGGKHLAFRLQARLAVWGLESGELSRRKASECPRIYSLVPDPDGRHLLIGSSDGIHRVDPLSGRVNRIVKTRDAVFHLAVAPDGRRAYFLVMHAACFGNPTTGALEEADWVPVHEDACFSRDGRKLFLTTNGGQIVECDPEKQSTTALHDEGAVPTRYQREPMLALSPDGRWLVTSSNADDAALKVMDLRKRTTRIVALPHGEELRRPAFAPDSRTVAVSAKFATLLYDVVAGKELGALVGAGGWVKGLAFSPDGGMLAVSTHDGEVRLLPWRELLAAPAG
jgi:hypothetical protein